MLKKYWIKCPICNGKTRVQVFHNTVLKDFPLFCPKCKLTHIIDVEKFEFGSDIVYMAMLNAKHVGTRQSSRLLYRPVYKEVFSPPGVTDEPQNVFHDALLNYQKHYLLF